MLSRCREDPGEAMEREREATGLTVQTELCGARVKSRQRQGTVEMGALKSRHPIPDLIHLLATHCMQDLAGCRGDFNSG